MSEAWRRFIFVRFPAAVILLAVLCQLVALALSHVPARRNRSDDLALAVMADHSAHRVVLLGDSVTRDSTSRFSLGKTADDVVNLSTTGAVGVPGEYFLLSRYLEAHPPPAFVVLSFSPEVYFGFIPIDKRRHYLWYPFSKPEERTFLNHYLPEIGRPDLYPAAMELGDDVFDHLYGLFNRSRLLLTEPTTFPDETKPVDPVSENLATPTTMKGRAASDLSAPVGDIENASIVGICRLVAKTHSRLAVVWPPAPKGFADALRDAKVYDRVDQQFAEEFERDGCPAIFFNMNSLREYGSFRLDAMHVRGEGWEERVAADYRNVLSNLPATQAPGGAPIG